MLRGVFESLSANGNESIQPSYRLTQIAQFGVIAVAVIAAIANILVSSRGDAQTTAASAGILAVALFVVAFAYAGGFRRIALSARKRAFSQAIVEHPAFVTDLSSQASSAREILGLQTTNFGSLSYAANAVLSGFQRLRSTENDPNRIRLDRIEEVTQLRNSTGTYWDNMIKEVVRLCDGPAKQSTEDFVVALDLMDSYLMGSFATAYRFIEGVRSLPPGSSLGANERDLWDAFQKRANGLLDGFDDLLRRCQVELKINKRCYAERVRQLW